VRDVPTLRWRVTPDLELLRSDVPAERRQAVRALGRAGDQKAVELLSACLLDPDVDVTYDAAKTLAAIGSDAAVDGLLRVVDDERCPIVRRVAATFALGEVPAIPEHAVGVLRRLLSATIDPWLKAAARTSLVDLRRY
jgi:HEAT repeat protein